MVLPRETVEAIRRATDDGAKSITAHGAQIVDADGRWVARAGQLLYVRRKR